MKFQFFTLILLYILILYMEVINVTVTNIRPQYKNLHEWCKNKNNAYIGRRGVVFIDGVRYPLENSIWCNPFKISDQLDREKCIEKYREYIENI